MVELPISRTDGDPEETAGVQRRGQTSLELTFGGGPLPEAHRGSPGKDPVFP